MNLNSDSDDKLVNRLSYLYMDELRVKIQSSGMLVWLPEYRFDLLELEKIKDHLFQGKALEIDDFITDGLKNNFSAEAISEFVTSNESMFFGAAGQIYSMKIDGTEQNVEFVDNKSLRIMKFLLLILDISQDENFRNPKQKLTIDYILELAENITDYKLRCRFKMAAISYFLPDDNEYIKSHLSSVMSDMKKLFARELSDDNNEIETECKFNIKHMILDMLTAKRNLIRKDIAKFNMGKNSNFMRAFDPWTSPVKKTENNDGSTNYKFVKYLPYAYYHDCLPDDVLRRQNNLQDGNFEDQSTQESSVIANDLNEIDESEDESEISEISEVSEIDEISEINDILNFIPDDIKDFKNPDGEINFVGDDADRIQKLFLIWGDNNYPREKKSAGLNNILDFAADYIKKLVDNNGNKVVNFFWYTGFLFFDIRNLFSDKVLLKKIDELLKENEHNQNDYKIFTLVLALLQNNNDGLHYFNPFVIAERFANETVLQKKLNTEMKFKLLSFVRKCRRNVEDNMFNEYYEKLYKILFSDGYIRWKTENRLLKFYKDKFLNKDESTNELINFLFDNRHDLADDQELINALCIGKHDQITEFIKNGLENNFSTQAISEFIIDNKSMFFNETGQIYSVEINGEKQDVRFVGSKSLRVMKFLLLVLDISQDENFRNPKQELTIDYILDLAKNIDDHKDRYKFKILALSYFLPETNAWVDDGKICNINFSQYITDIKKLFADELSTKNKKIDEKDRLEIKRMAIDMLTVDRHLVRKDASDLNLGDDSYLGKYCSCLKDRTKKFSYYHLSKGCGVITKLDVIDGILDFFEDDIKKSINDKDANNNFFKSNGLLFSNIRSLSYDKDLLQKINELIEKNQNGQNDHKIFVLIFALIQDCDSPDFCIDKIIAREAKTVDNPYGPHVYDDILKYLSGNLSPEMKLKLLFFFYEQSMYVYKNSGKNEVHTDDKYFSEKNKLVNIFYPNFEEYIRDFCALCKKDKFSKIAFGSLAWTIFAENHDNAYSRHERSKNMLKCVSDKILEGDKDINPFLYDFLDQISIHHVNLVKQNKYLLDESVIIFDYFIQLIEKDKNMSDDAKNEINNFIITFFDFDNLKRYLQNERFVECLAHIVKDKKFDFCLPSQKKYFFAYIKECLKSVINNDQEKNVLTQYKEQKDEKDRLTKKISGLNDEINYCKKFYWFNLVPVLGWIGCGILYFSKVKSMENELNRLRTQLENIESVISEIENLGCKNIETFINSGDNYDKNKTNSNLEIANKKEENISNNNASDEKPLFNELGNVKSQTNLI